MPSRALVLWESRQQRELDRLEAAHIAVGGPGPGRRAATQQIDDAYIVLLAAAFQQYCRNLHTEAAEFLAASAPHMASIVEQALLDGRQLDRGNATPSSLGSDFRRLGIALWPALEACDRRTAGRKRRLEQLNAWRNAIAHGDFRMNAHAAAVVAGTGRTLAFAQACRASCQGLAHQLDVAVGARLHEVLARRVW